GDGRIGAIYQNQELSGLAAQKLAIEIEGNFQADARPASDHLAGEFTIGMNVLVDAESIGIAEAVEQSSAFPAARAGALRDAAAAELALQFLAAHGVAEQSVDGAPKNRGAANFGDLAGAAQRAGDFRRSDLEAMHAHRIHFRQGA